MLGRLLLLLLPSALFAQTTQEKVRDFRQSNEHQILKEFTALLSIPNVAADTENIRKNAALIVQMMKQRELNPRLAGRLKSSTPPAVYGEWKVAGAQRTILLYAHYDGQPTDPKQWTGTLPWQPVFRSGAIEAGGQIVVLATHGTINPEYRIYARSASDDKAGVMAILTAFSALKEKASRSLPTSSSSLRVRKRPARRISATSSIATKNCLPLMYGSSVMDQCISQE